MKYRKITSIFISLILVGHIIAAISYGTASTMYWKLIRNSSVDTEGASDYSSRRFFKYRFFDAKMKYTYKFKQEEFKQESCILMFNFAERTSQGKSDNCSNFAVFNKRTKEEAEYEVCSSSIILPIEKDNESKAHLLFSIFGILIILYSFLIFYLLKKVLDSVKFGSPFINKNVLRLRRIALMILALPLAILLFEVLLYYSIISKYIFVDSLIRLSFNFNLGLFIGGILLLFISETFKQGIRIREEQELTI